MSNDAILSSEKVPWLHEGAIVYVVDMDPARPSVSRPLKVTDITGRRIRLEDNSRWLQHNLTNKPTGSEHWAYGSFREIGKFLVGDTSPLLADILAWTSQREAFDRVRAAWMDFFARKSDPITAAPLARRLATTAAEYADQYEGKL